MSYRLVRILRRPGSFGDMLADQIAVLDESARPDGLGRLPVRLAQATPVYIEPKFLDDVDEEMRGEGCRRVHTPPPGGRME